MKVTKNQQENLKFTLAEMLDIHLDPASDTDYDELEALTRAIYRTVEKHTTVVEGVGRVRMNPDRHDGEF